jgi:hypothetical protein
VIKNLIWEKEFSILIFHLFQIKIENKISKEIYICQMYFLYSKIDLSYIYYYCKWMLLVCWEPLATAKCAIVCQDLFVFSKSSKYIGDIVSAADWQNDLNTLQWGSKKSFNRTLFCNSHILKGSDYGNFHHKSSLGILRWRAFEVWFIYSSII